MIVVDVETTGIDPRKNSVVSIGAVEFYNPTNQFYIECRIWDGAKIEPRALEINGFTVKEITDPKKPIVWDAAREFLKWASSIEGKILAGENPSFDRDFLVASLKTSDDEWVFGYRTDDLHTACRDHYFTRGLKPPMKDGKTALDLEAILKYVGLSDEPDPHIAIIGARMEAEAFSRLRLGKYLLPEFARFPVPEYCRRAA